MNEIVFHQVNSWEERELAGLLIREYLAFLNARLKQDYGIEFDMEAMVKSDITDNYKFHPPEGRFYLVRHNDQIAGIGCLKKLEDGMGEVQRMYVAPSFRGQGIGRSIANRLIEDARLIGYHTLKLESLGFLDAAHALYRSLGFKDIDPYSDNSMESFQAEEQLDKYYSIAVFMEMNLQK